MSDDTVTIRVGGREVPLEKSETGDFGVTKDELKFIIRRQLSKRKSRTQMQRVLFGSVLSSMKMNPRGDTREAMLKVFVETLREMRDAGEVSFKSGKTSLLVELL